MSEDTKKYYRKGILLMVYNHPGIPLPIRIYLVYVAMANSKGEATINTHTLIGTGDLLSG